MVEDLTGAADALTRLQTTYLLSPADIARGSLDTFCCTTKLNGENDYCRNCFTQRAVILYLTY